MQQDEVVQQIESRLKFLRLNVSKEVANEVLKMFLKKSKNKSENVDVFVDSLVESGTLNTLQLDYEASNEIKNDGQWRRSRRNAVYSEKITPETFKLKNYPKDDATVRFLKEILVADIPFGFMNPEQKRRLIESMELMDVQKGTVVTQEGALGSEMHIIESGVFEVSKDGEVLRRLYRGNFFGEIALLHNISRTATVKAITDGKVWVVEQTSFSGIRMMDRIANKKVIIEGLRENGMFGVAGDDDETVLNRVSFVHYKNGSKVEIGDSEFLMIVSEGEIDDGETRKVSPKEVLRVGFIAVTEIEVAHIPELCEDESIGNNEE
ncbi:yclic nucleotide-binding domain-containing protein [Ordospora colligata]|uniref:Cyclic nucleotide-binding domain-containing protein n=1 Tax=Ordospora colligata OC4 TaxID=1354746 RepID=A0A0B2UJK8_9MICR|nr:cyclic nucleotide-binding domain-containing protein [Ordospora colligata OC4]KHN69165.1 cyclic nucleotide-binding domain-containing protein [Ordospora colligata OC4]TBU14620.1 cyclic nucleotide-binding domain-containing protein [Ordospora colligata]TBU14814.1 cyclic nucleotide-binding domain-containing protein [Ordospora colligata]TBU18137.1 yclic nucleotide-binding domain-containing protein [Ordospora colligata]